MIADVREKSLTDFKLRATCANIVQRNMATSDSSMLRPTLATSCQHVAFVCAERYSGLVLGSLSSLRKLHKQKENEQKEEIIVGYIRKR